MIVLCLFLYLTLGSVHPASAKVLPPTGRTYFDHNACVTSTAYIFGYPCHLDPLFDHDLRNCFFNSDLSSPPTFILLNCGSQPTSSTSASSSSSFFLTHIIFKWPCQVSFNNLMALYYTLYSPPLKYSHLFFPKTHKSLLLRSFCPAETLQHPSPLSTFTARNYHSHTHTATHHTTHTNNRHHVLDDVETAL